MKVRDGFVSNSSTASFIVKYRDWWKKDKVYLDEETCKKLEEYGFKKSDASYPSQIDHECEVTDKEFCSYSYSVIVNEMDDLEWLIENNIPFIADCHYDQYTIIYEKDSDHVLVLKNMGIYYQMITNNGFSKDITNEVGARRIPKNEFKNGYYI